jgi:hypothetical protein
VYRKVTVLLMVALAVTLSMATGPLAFAHEDYDYSYVCEDVINRIWTGDPSLTAAELLSCGKSPEVIGAKPSINGPYGVGTENECSYLPQGSPESVACFGELIASMGY